MPPMWRAPVARSVDVAFVVVLLVVAVVAAVVVMVMRRNRSANSSVDSFRRHIDALGPEARRTVVDQVQSAAGRSATDDDAVTDGEAAPADRPEIDTPDATSGGEGSDEGPSDKDGSRGT